MKIHTNQLTATALRFEPIQDEDYSGYFITIQVEASKGKIENSNGIVTIDGTITVEVAAEESETCKDVFNRVVSSLFR